jgi:cytochrome c oxidase cbb3-type subunit 2
MDVPVSIDNIADHLKANRAVGVPYDDDMIDNARADLLAQANPAADTTGLEARYPKAQTGAFDGDPARVTEMDALVAYLQMLGTLVDFSTYDEMAGRR